MNVSRSLGGGLRGKLHPQTNPKRSECTASLLASAERSAGVCEANKSDSSISQSVVHNPAAWEMELALAEVGTIAARIAEEVMRQDYFCLWLNGDIGVGKTYWVNSFLHCLGLEDEVVVTSPTYVHAREYSIAVNTYNHADLYRIESVNAFLTLGFDNSRYRGEIYEWASPTNCCTPPTHKLDIDFTLSLDSRLYRFFA